MLVRERVRGRNQFADGVDLGYRYIHRTSYVLYSAASQHPSEGHYLGDVIYAVLFDYVGYQLVAPFVGDIGIYIGHAYAFRVQEAFKEQIIPYRVKVGYPERVGDKRTGRGAASRAYRDISFLRGRYYVGNDAEVAREVHLFDNSELIFEAFCIFLRRIICFKPVFEPLARYLAQMRRKRLSLRKREFRQVVVSGLQLYIAPVGYHLRVGKRFRQLVSEDRPHLFGRTEIVVVTGKAVAFFVRNEASGLYAEQYVVPSGVFALQVM